MVGHKAISTSFVTLSSILFITFSNVEIWFGISLSSLSRMYIHILPTNLHSTIALSYLSLLSSNSVWVSKSSKRKNEISFNLSSESPMYNTKSIFCSSVKISVCTLTLILKSTEFRCGGFHFNLH